ncbi:MAG: TerB N-terminal domain-containing protein [Defluviitaleaceae bacterium]|nr:TerB N-terminal domain-containing protein [Defluviitaleaceae bacterium]
MDNQKQYTSLKIPPRNQQPRPNNPPSQYEDIFSAAKFAEIEYESIPTPSGYQASQPIGQRQSDPIKDKFQEMRRIFYDNPYSRNDAHLFYMQAKFMADFNDDYPLQEPFSMYYPNYQHMSYEQLRTYFTWRANTRLGVHAHTSLSYIYVYIYELLSGIGSKGPAHGRDMLMNLWNAHRDETPVLDKYIPEWLKDYHIYYGLPFMDFVKEHDFINYYPELFMLSADSKHCLDLWNEISSYNITKSNFYKGNEDELHGCFHAVVEAIKAFCTSKGTTIAKLLTHEIYTGVPWRPYNQALFYPWIKQADRKVELPGPEVYYCTNNIWTADISMHRTTRGDIVGYIIRETESCLRKALKHKHQMTAYTQSMAKSFRGFTKIGFTRQSLGKIIEKTVADYHQSTKRTVVVVDTKNLTRIRQESQETQDALIVPEIAAPPHKPAPPPLKNPLTSIEIEALTAFIQENIDLKSFADSKGIMPEVLADNINEKLSDIIGDNVLDEDFNLYEDYLDQIKEMVITDE